MLKGLEGLATVSVVAPSQERSAAAQSLTVRHPIFCEQIAEREWAIEGTPADAMMVALHRLFPKPPDLVISGINKGPNLGENVFYSGTVGAATEAVINHVPAIAISLAHRGNGFVYDHAALLTRSNAAYGGGVLLRCPALVSLMLWERHVVEPAAKQELGRRITGIRQLGTYSCRNINHAAFGRRSQHALAKAIDIASFRTDEGTVISIARDWSDAGSRGKFLHAVRDGACRFFGVVLSPDYNALHHDHLHLDTGIWSVCR